MAKLKINKTLKIIFLGGVGEIGKNMTAIEYNDDMIVIDAGLSFPNSEELPGIEYIIPDYTYLKQNAHKLKGLVLTHGHEDHIGATPYVLRDLRLPVYGSAFTIALVEHKLSETKVKGSLNVVEAGQKVRLGCFEVEFVAITHSIAGAFALKISTPQGVVFHTGDFKVDYTPVDHRLPDISRIAEIGNEGVDIMMMDSTNVERGGYSMSESKVGEKLEEIFVKNNDKRIIIATFASNIHRVQQILNCAVKSGRRVAFAGRSIENYVEIAERIGELKIPRNSVVEIGKIAGIPYDKLCIICTGSQGEPMSALYRMANDEYKKVKIKDTDTILFSSSPIPGNEKPIYDVINKLCKKGANVFYHSLDAIHASGHACREELKLMYELVKPRHFIPVHGEYRHLMIHKELVMKLGEKGSNVILPDLGTVVEYDKRKGFRQGNSITTGAILMDGNVMGVVDELVLEERKRLASDGIIIAHVAFSVVKRRTNATIDYTIKGMPNIDKIIALIDRDTHDLVNNGTWIDLDMDSQKAELGRLIRRLVLKKLEKRPMIIPVIDEVNV